MKNTVTAIILHTHTHTHTQRNTLGKNLSEFKRALGTRDVRGFLFGIDLKDPQAVFRI
jgi:hypothetical protein